MPDKRSEKVAEIQSLIREQANRVRRLLDEVEEVQELLDIKTEHYDEELNYLKDLVSWRKRSGA